MLLWLLAGVMAEWTAVASLHFPLREFVEVGNLHTCGAVTIDSEGC